MPQRVAITGSSGLIGGALSAYLSERGDQVVALVRRPVRSPAEVRWSPGEGRLDPRGLDGVSAVVNLAGAGIGDRRWTASYKRELAESRTNSTSTIVRALHSIDHPVRLLNGSAIGYYGDRGDEVLDESSASGTGFLAQLVTDWESATAAATAEGHPTAFARTGLVLAPHGGSMGRVLPLARLGLAGPLGNGRQWWSWISLVDEVRALAHLIDHPEITGAVNLVGPSPVRQAEAMRALGRIMHRPAFLPAPAPALRLVLGEFAGDVLGGQRVRPDVLEASGFTWQHDAVADALRWVVTAHAT
ncbi:TIGR01777 family oxidoreductase [Leekyejoonella antrihumi]|uniref:TIGR01777 family protein n=1 Tax=Leekyejoonella antrihumi TaxID=1660198 RepID=A0A563E3Q0_9MICO|nr:TIGR01777 family oxidoreductase [Leekyejoonella antrihumi]TWP37035.1 TIGR01777 family protein [Leekyejoonella antrihumi]